MRPGITNSDESPDSAVTSDYPFPHIRSYTNPGKFNSVCDQASPASILNLYTSVDGRELKMV
jgi:hypothetical protein